ncbi:hypothetical protein ACRE_017090 [Hapsidospora chrysogenum ATCC 11550]|uniref:Uncharacterized protein n=1 Tax=Hapsidospora chrysogenum (strain ATCC 11550 / CBS 779.69 / DSM 880 / IAM 14645 / JCM 23072 / IMI 49137) TaxID=857340 RepID=A0A086TDL2_HAPC1|nr:hypothetical protein ACRE_017090 [Hapsidospora chrysogenum ATCC 11550]
MALGQGGDGVDHHATTATNTVAQEERYERPGNSFAPINGRRSTAVPGPSQVQPDAPAQRQEQQKQREGPSSQQARVLATLDMPTRDWKPDEDGSGKKKCPYCLTPVRVKDAAEHTKVHRFQDMRPEYFILLRKGGRCERCRRGKGQICKVFKNPSKHNTFVCKSCHSLRERCSHMDFKESYNPRRVEVHPALAMDVEV